MRPPRLSWAAKYTGRKPEDRLYPSHRWDPRLTPFHLLGCVVVDSKNTLASEKGGVAICFSFSMWTMYNSLISPKSKGNLTRNYQAECQGSYSFKTSPCPTGSSLSRRQRGVPSHPPAHLPLLWPPWHKGRTKNSLKGKFCFPPKSSPCFPPHTRLHWCSVMVSRRTVFAHPTTTFVLSFPPGCLALTCKGCPHFHQRRRHARHSYRAAHYERIASPARWAGKGRPSWPARPHASSTIGGAKYLIHSPQIEEKIYSQSLWPYPWCRRQSHPAELGFTKHKEV